MYFFCIFSIFEQNSLCIFFLFLGCLKNLLRVPKFQVGGQGLGISPKFKCFFNASLPPIHRWGIQQILSIASKHLRYMQ